MIVNIFIGLLGYIFYDNMSSKEVGQRNQLDIYLSNKLGRKINFSLKFKFRIKDKMIYLHCHHWLYLLIIVGLISLFEYTIVYIKYFALGGVVQGMVKYKDWYNVVYIEDIKNEKKDDSHREIQIDNLSKKIFRVIQTFNII